MGPEEIIGEAPRLRAFRGVRYSAGLAKELPRLLAPPYDLISPAQQRQLYRAHPNNIVRLILGKEYAREGPQRNRYTRAAHFLRQWLAKGILSRDAQPALYRYWVEYETEQGEKRLADGLLTMLHLSTPEAPVLPHESIRPAPLEYVLELTKHCRAQLSPVITVYGHPQQAMRQRLSQIDWGEPLVEVVVKRERHLLFACTDAAAIARLSRLLGSQPVLIADGHHRYQAACDYRDYMARPGDEKTALHNYILTWMHPLEGGLSLWPTHRVVNLRQLEARRALARLKGLCELAPAPRINSWQKAGQALRHKGQSDRTRHRFLALHGRPCRATLISTTRQACEELEPLALYPEWRELDVVMLEQVLLRGALGLDKEDISYNHDLRTVWRAVATGEADMAFLLNPPTISQVQNIAAAGRRMPPKSTYFHPKPLSGMALALLD